MSNRLQVGSGVQDPQLDVTAAPVNTFNPNAGNAAGNKLAQLAQGLSTIAPEISRYAEIQQTQVNDKQTAAGVAAGVAFAQSGKKYADAVKSGQLPQVANPYFMMAFHEQLGRVVGDQEHADLIIARKSDDNLQTTTDQSDYAAFDAAHHEQWMKDNVSEKDQNSSFMTGYTSRQATYMQSDSQSIANEIAGRIGKQSNDAQHDEQMTNIQQNIAAGRSPVDIAKDLNDANNDLIHTGRKASEVMQTSVKAIYDAAIQDPQNGMAILEALKSMKGAFGPLSNTVYGTAAYTKGREDVGQLVAQSHKLANQQKEEATTAAVDDAYRQVAAARTADPHADISAIQSKLAQVAPQKAAELAEFTRNLQGSTITTNDASQSDLLMGIYTDGSTTTASINTALKNKQITWQTAAEDYQKLDEYTKMKGDGKGPLDPQYNRALTELKGRFTTGIGAIFTADAADRYNRAQGTFTADFAAFLQTPEGQKAGWKEKNEWFVHEADAVAKQYTGAVISNTSTTADLSGQANRGTVAAKPAAAPVSAKATPAGVTYPATRVVSQADLVAFISSEKAGGPAALTITDAAKKAAARYGATSTADLIAFMHSQIHTNP